MMPALRPSAPPIRVAGLSQGVAYTPARPARPAALSGPWSGWQAVAKLEEQLKARGWTVRRVKEDGGCYEVYALDETGKRGEFYFHPVTLEPVPTRKP